MNEPPSHSSEEDIESCANGLRNVSWRLWLTLVVVVLLLASFLLPLPYDPSEPDGAAKLMPPSSDHWFGTDKFGFDVFSRVIAAARLDVPLALSGMAVSLVLGVVLGLLASGKTRWSEWFMSGLDVFQVFPLLLLALVFVALLGNELSTVVFAIAILNVPRFVRLVRSEALSLRESRFIEAAYAIGASRSRVMVRHLLPNMTGIIGAQASLAVAQAIVVIAALSFLGVGVSPTDPSWGSMIRSGSQNMSTGEWWVSLFPGIAVFLAVTAFNVIADAVPSTDRRSH
jgi:peptide/nickel transport system permease protein